MDGPSDFPICPEPKSFFTFSVSLVPPYYNNPNLPRAGVDDRDYVVALAQARADVAAAQGEIENISATIDQQQAVIAQADGTVAVDKATLQFAEQDYARYKDL